MYTFNWKPDSKSKFDGTIEVMVPTHMQRIQFLKSLTGTVNEKGELVSDATDAALKIIEFAKQFIQKVSLKRKEDGCVVPDVTWLDYDVEGADVLKEIGTILFQGIKLGKI